MKTSWPLHLIFVALAGAFIGLCFLQEPGFGDDLTYWSTAFNLHERGFDALQRQSFHDLRWPVWGVCWILQALFGPGLISYYGVPLFYLALGAMLAFAFARLLTRSIALGWLAALLFAFHPLLDTVCYRPMPDLSEGVWGSAAVLAWWLLVCARSRAARVTWAILAGVAIFIAESNRITGAFIVPVLILCTLLYARRSFVWLLVAGAVSAALYVAEAAAYHQLFGDWLHSIHANLGNKGAKGTEAPALWYLPFRFIDTLWKGNPLAPVTCLLALAGIARAWRSRPAEIDPLHEPPPPLGRVLVIWFLGLFLIYSCAPQDLSPYRPMLRDADRFLAALAIPMSVLAAAGLLWLPHFTRLRTWQWFRWIELRPALLLAVSALVMFLATSRSFFDLGFVPKFQRYLQTLPAGTQVFTHHAMRDITFLVDAGQARRVQWLNRNHILHSTTELEELAAKAQEFWYARKLVWLRTRKELERGKHQAQPALTSLFAAPEKEWRMTMLLAKGDTPDLVFYRRRTGADPAPAIIEAPALLPGGTALPAEWTSKDPRRAQFTVTLPASVRGRLARLEGIASSDQVEGATVLIDFLPENKSAEFLLKPYFFPTSGEEFFALPLPPGEGDIQARVTLKISGKTKALRLENLRLIVD